MSARLDDRFRKPGDTEFPWDEVAWLRSQGMQNWQIARAMKVTEQWIAEGPQLKAKRRRT